MEATPDRRDELHRLVDALPEGETHAAKRYLEYLAERGDPFLRAILNAPVDEEPLSEKERAVLEEGLRALKEGETVTDEELRAELGI